MGILFEFLFQILFEIFGSIILEVVLAFFKEVFHRDNRGPILATLGFVALGAILGAGSVLAFAERFVRLDVPRGISVVIAPLIGGLALHYWGGYRAARGHTTTSLASFHGGAGLLFAYSLVRVLWAR